MGALFLLGLNPMVVMRFKLEVGITFPTLKLNLKFYIQQVHIQLKNARGESYG